MYRTDYCGTFSEKDIGRRVRVCGWVQKQRDLGKLIFIDLRDRTGIVIWLSVCVRRPWCRRPALCAPEERARSI